MARTGVKRLTFPFSLDAMDFLQKAKNKLEGHVSVNVSADRDQIEIELRGPRANVQRASHDLKALYKQALE